MSVKVRRRDGESIDQLIRRFRLATEREGIPTEIREREFYDKPSEIKRRKEKEINNKYARRDALRKSKYNNKKLLF